MEIYIVSAQIFINIIQDPQAKQDLITLIDRQIIIDNYIADYKYALDDIKKEYTALGIKPTEFKNACKYYQQEELLMNELATLEQYVELLNND